jgi:GNAT superfamily N-acetyltransferase
MPESLSVLPLDRLLAPDRRRFIEVARAIYAADPRWVAPLDSELHGVLGPRNPFYQHAEGQLWWALRDGRPVGRIAAFVDRTHNQLHQERTGFFGFFESVNDPAVAEALLTTARRWLAERGMDRIRGPMNPSINDECGLLVEGFERPPVLMMRYNPPGYAALLEGTGLTRVKDLLAFIISVAEAPETRLRKVRRHLEERHPELRLRMITRQSLPQDVPLIKRVYNEAWENNWGAVPLSEPEIDFLVERLAPLLVNGLVWMAECHGEPVGFLLALPDFNEALQPLRGRLLSWGLLRAVPYLAGWRKPRIMRLVALGVRAEYRGRGLEAAMLAETLTACQREGFQECEASWVLEDNEAVQRVIRIFGGKRYKAYRLYERAV